MSSSSSSRYEPLLKIASGGTASVWVGAAAGAHGFRQLVAIKRPHEHLADDPQFVAALIEEAKIASRLRHANAVDVRDIEADESGVQLVMDWVEGASLSELIRAWQKEEPARSHAVAIRVVLDACEGLRALHELTDDEGRPLGCVHRDVSPANVLVGLDGVGRITDFGLARPLLAVERTTSQGALRGKLGYMAPEYIKGKDIDHRVDVFAMAIVLWESLARRRLFRGENDAETLERVQREDAPKLADLPNAGARLGAAAPEIDALLAKALAKDPAERTPSIAELVTELDRIARAHDMIASHTEVRESFGPTLRGSLESRRREVQRALAVSEGKDPSAVSALTGPPSRPPQSIPAMPAIPDAAPMITSIAPNAAVHTGTIAATPEAIRIAATSVPPPPSASAKEKKKKSAAPIWAGALVLFGIVLVGGTIGIALALRSPTKPLSTAAATHVVDPDIQSRADDEPRTLAAASSTPSASASPGARRHPKHAASSATHSGGPAATTAAAAAHGDSENKAPRPNPYASAAKP